jgi:hypothetical protein
MTKLNSLARARVIGPEGGAEDGAAGAGVEGAAGVDVLVVSSSTTICGKDGWLLSSVARVRSCGMSR